MADCEMDPANLKSFQRISQEDLRYLRELGEATAQAHNEKAPVKLELKQLPAKILTLIENTIERLFFETVPAHEVYASRE